MNDETAGLLLDVAERLERSIRARECPAIVALEGQRKLVLSDYDYLRDEAAAASFERRAAAQAREIGVRRWVLAVPQVWRVRAGVVSTRAVSNHPLRDGEQEAITWMSFDADEGVDYGRVAFTRLPGGEPVFAEPEIFTVKAEARPAPGAPGHTLLRVLMDDNDPLGP
jgi:hypothetical protein